MAPTFSALYDPVSGAELKRYDGIRGNGAAFDPVTKQFFIARNAGAAGRVLATLDLATGAATDIGAFGDKVAGLTFDDAGTLYAVTGDGASASASLFTVDKTTGAMTLVRALGNGNDGESIAFNPNDGLIYHWSGFLSDEIMETVDPVSLAVSAVPGFGAETPSEVFGSVFDPSTGTFILTDIDANFFDTATDGTTVSLSTATNVLRGHAIPRGCPRSPVSLASCEPDGYVFDSADGTFCIRFGALPVPFAASSIVDCSAEAVTVTGPPPITTQFDRTYSTRCRIAVGAAGEIATLTMDDGDGTSVLYVACGVLAFEDPSRKRAPVLTSSAAGGAGAFAALAGGASGDPHIVGAQGQHFDFFGKPNAIYTLFSAPQFVVNMKLLAHGPKARYIDTLYVRVRNVTLHFDTGAYKPRKLQQRIDRQLAGVEDVHVVVSEMVSTIELCDGHSIVVQQRVDVDPIDHKKQKLYHLDVKIEVPGCHNDFGGVLGETYRCDGQFKWDRSREEEFHVRYGRVVRKESKFSPKAPCHDNAKEFAGHQSISGNTGKQSM